MATPRYPPWLLNSATLFVLVAGGANLLMGFVRPDYTPNPALTGLFVTAVGPMLALGFIRNGGP